MLGNKVRTLREAMGYTQANLAEVANLSIRTIKRIEADRSTPKGHILNCLVEALNVDKKELQVLADDHEDAARIRRSLFLESVLIFDSNKKMFAVMKSTISKSPIIIVEEFTQCLLENTMK